MAVAWSQIAALWLGIAAKGVLIFAKELIRLFTTCEQCRTNNVMHRRDARCNALVACMNWCSEFRHLGQRMVYWFE